MPSNSSAKRKQPPSITNPKSGRATKRIKTSSARSILAQASDKALNQNGDLDVAAFVKAREFEIKALEASMTSSKKSLTTRAFQQVPRSMRRRTASHNVKKVPKRLRARAAKEMKNDNTPTVTSRRRPLSAQKRLRAETAKNVQKPGPLTETKLDKSKDQPTTEENSGTAASAPTATPRAKKNTLAIPVKPPSKFRKRQINKSWLPTHVYHAKRAHMTPPTEPLWRHAIPLTPTDKCYRATHRAISSRGCVVWDTSYMSTIGAEGVEASLVGLLRGLGVEEVMLGGKAGSKWRRGTRGWEGWISERDGEQRKMAQATIIWDVPIVEGVEGHTEGKKKTRKTFVRVHPSAFFQVWGEILKVAKIQRPPVMVEDLRFEIGSIEVMGPGSTEALISALHPFVAEDKTSNDGPEGKPETKPETMPEKLWPCLCEVTNPASLPPNALLGFEINDPRLHHPPRTVKSTISSEALLQTLATWPLDTSQTNPTIFHRKARFTACRLLSSQKSINRRKGDALPGVYPDPLPQDPRIPILLAASRAPSQGGQGSWRLLLPWKIVLPVWNSLIHYPLTMGENPRFGCLQEQRQIAFEQGNPWFPGDFPGTKAGWEWEMMERGKRKAEWEKRPKGKRVAWESIDLGDGTKGEVGIGWACDWERLFQGASSAASEMRADPIDPASVMKADPIDPVSVMKADPIGPISVMNAAGPQTPSPPLVPQEPGLQDPPSPPFSIHHVPTPISARSASPTALATISITILSRGNPTVCARIYRLPTTNPTLRDAWIAQTKVTKTNKPPLGDFRPFPTSLPKATPSYIRVQQLAAGLLASPPNLSALQPGASNPAYPRVPGEEDLIGFVTTGNFDLSQGRARAIGCVALARVESAPGVVGGSRNNPIKSDGNTSRTEGMGAHARLCIVREAGQSMGRLARWGFV